MDKRPFYIVRSRSRRLDEIQNDDVFNSAKHYLDRDHVERNVDDDALEQKFQELADELGYRSKSVVRLAAAVLSESGEEESKVFVTDDVRLLLDAKNIFDRHGVIVTDIEGLSRMVGISGGSD